MGKLSEVERLTFRDDPAYEQGFWDARDLTPLFDDAALAYRAGWEAYWACRELLEQAGFSLKGAGIFSKTTVVPAGRSALLQEGGSDD